MPTMPYLIDGHNLIGKLPGIELSDPDDEAALAQVLQAHMGRTRHRATVFFDRATPGGTREVKLGLLTLHFVRRPATADDAIIAHLRRLGGDAHNWTVVTSDRQVQAAAHAAGARVLDSEAFVAQMQAERGSFEPAEKPQGMSEDELAYWEDVFKKKRPPHGRPPKS